MRTFFVVLVLVGLAFVAWPSEATADPVPSRALTDGCAHYPSACACPPRCGAPYPYYRPYYKRPDHFCRARYYYRPPWGNTCRPSAPRPKYYRARR